MSVPLAVSAQTVGAARGGTAKRPEFLAALAPVIGSVIGAIGDIWSAKRTQEFQERMSSTSFQRGVLDLQRAGLSPLLAYDRGGASTPQGALVQPGRSIAESASSAARVSLEKQRTQSEIALNTATAAAQESQALSRAKEVLVRQGEYNLEVERQKHGNALLDAQRMKEIALAGQSVAATRETSARAEREGYRLAQEKYDERFYKALDEATTGKGSLTWDDIKRLALGFGFRILRRGE